MRRTLSTHNEDVNEWSHFHQSVWTIIDGIYHKVNTIKRWGACSLQIANCNNIIFKMCKKSKRSHMHVLVQTWLWRWLQTLNDRIECKWNYSFLQMQQFNECFFYVLITCFDTIEWSEWRRTREQSWRGNFFVISIKLVARMRNNLPKGGNKNVESKRTDERTNEPPAKINNEWLIH